MRKSPVVSIHRMASFANKKEGRENVFYRVNWTLGGVMCGKAADMLAIGRDKQGGSQNLQGRPSWRCRCHSGATTGPADAHVLDPYVTDRAWLPWGWNTMSAMELPRCKEMAPRKIYSTTQGCGGAMNVCHQILSQSGILIYQHIF
jgi:hypothetical protein